uniref:Cytochrome P450 n=1 Tax=Leptobrachium leishanense TaxID=445787 RepID=A0A8C5QP61_9ANUR
MESIGIDELLVGLIYIVWNSMRRKHKLPPGPTPLPLIGNLLQIQRGQLVNSLLKFSKQYGSVYTLYFGPKPVICLSGYETVKEALIDKAEEFGGRGRLPTLEKVVQMYGITLSNGERWRQIRNFTFRNLRDLGFGKKRFEEKVQEEAQYVVEELKKLKEKLQMEIDRVIGRDRIPIINDRADMPYTDAVMNEVHRFCDLAPFSVPHMVTKDVEFRGYLIPKGTEVYPLLFSVHRDPTKFSTPYKFNPNHFLDENGKFMKNDAMMAFSAGKRICPGESLARMEFFLFLTTILQNFKLTSQTRFTEADIAPKLAGFLNTPIHYELSFIPRNGQTDRQTVMGRHWRNSQTNINSFLQLQCACLVQKEPFGSDIQVAKLKPRLDSKPSGQRLCSAQIVLSGCSAFH